MKRPRLRVAVLAALAVAVALVVLAAALGSGGGRRPNVASGPHATVVIPTRVVHGVRRPAAPSGPLQFVPAPAAVSVARSLALARRVAQLFVVAVPAGSGDPVASLGGLPWGGVALGASNFQSDSQISSLAGTLGVAIRSAGSVGPLIAVAQEGGQNSAIPDLPPQSEPAIGATGQPSVARDQALLAGKDLRALGFNMTIAPLADVDTVAGALGGRLYSTDPQTVARFTVAAVSGYSAAGIISAAGHFPGTGSASADPDQMQATVGGSLGQLRARDLIPFGAVAPTAPVIEMSNAVYPAFDGVTPAGLLGQAVGLLRRDYGFQGVVMSDDLDAALQATGADAGAAALAALRAGDDLLYLSGSSGEQQSAYAAVLSAAHGSASLRAQIHDALLRVLTLKARYGLLGANPTSP